MERLSDKTVEELNQLETALNELHKSNDVSDAAYSTLKFAVQQVKDCNLHIVSNRTELLLAREKSQYIDSDWNKNKEIVVEKIDKYLANISVCIREGCKDAVSKNSNYYCIEHAYQHKMEEIKDNT